MPLSPVSPRFALTEAALTLLVEAKRSGDEGLWLASRRAPRIFGSALGPVDPYWIQRQASVLRFVSVTEAFVDALMAERLTAHLIPPTTLLRRMAEMIELHGSSDWRARKAAFLKIHNIDLEKITDWWKVDAASQVRNSVAHGLGRLTAIQREDRHLAKRVALIDVTIGGNQLHLTDQSVATVFEACCAFIKSLDMAV